MRIVLLTPARRFISNRAGLGYQVPLGLVFIGGPLRDAGHEVRIIDNDVKGWSDERLVEELARDVPDCLMLGHSGSMAAHPTAMRTAQALRARFPSLPLVYGGVYPTFAAVGVLEENPALDVVVRGEGEATVRELADCLARGGELRTVKGIAFRERGRVVSTAPRPPIADLDQFRPGWELVDFDDYPLFGFARAAGMQFSRGCANRCSYCGQWAFWKTYRHRSPEAFVAELERLACDFKVGFVWLADENFAGDAPAAHRVLELLAERRLPLALNLQMTAAEVVRDEALMPLYKRAGVHNIMMGIESTNDAVVARVGKDNPLQVSREALRILRRHDIVSVANIIYGLEEERPTSLARTFRRLLQLDPDIVLSCFITPYFWTRFGRELDRGELIESELSRYTHRNQIVRAPHLSPWALFFGVKLSDALFHLRPRALWRLVAGGTALTRRLRRRYFGAGVRASLAELWELVAHRFVKPGTLHSIPGEATAARAETGRCRDPSDAMLWRGGQSRVSHDAVDEDPRGPAGAGTTSEVAGRAAG